MSMGRPMKFEIELSEQERTSLEHIAQSRSLPHELEWRTQIILLSADGQSDSTIAEQLGVSA